MNAQEYILNIRPGVGYAPTVKISQYDIGRPLQFHLYDGTAPLAIATGTTIKIHATKPSGLGFEEACTWSGSSASIDTTESMTQEYGIFPAELELSVGGDIIGTANFMMHIERSPHPEGTTDGVAEDLQDIYEQLADLKNDLSGWSDDTKQALLNCFANVVFNGSGQTYYDALEAALYPEEPPATLESISAVYTQSGTIYITDSLDDLQADLVVTGHYSDGTSATISSGYTLSGSLTEGTSTITVTYSGKTTTFNVTVTRYQLFDYIYNTESSGSQVGKNYVQTDLTCSPSFNTLNIEFEAMNSNNMGTSDGIIGANNQSSSDTGNIVWYSRANKGGFSAYNLGVAKQLTTVTGDTRAIIKYFFVDGGESYMQWESTTVAVATKAKSSIATNSKKLILAGGYEFSSGNPFGMLANGKTKLGYVKFTDPANNNALLYHFIPAKDLQTETYGFYEDVNKAFYPNSNGTGLSCGNWS